VKKFNTNFKNFILLTFLITNLSSCIEKKEKKEKEIFGTYIDGGAGLSKICLYKDSTFKTFQGDHSLTSSEYEDPYLIITFPETAECEGKFSILKKDGRLLLSFKTKNDSYPCYDLKYLIQDNSFKIKSGFTPGAWITYTKVEEESEN
jgi:hypothetical protein